MNGNGNNSIHISGNDTMLRQQQQQQEHKTVETSACLIVMDDNHFLIEWLAYHYHTANLRHLIITSDPHSRTSPSKVLDRWRDRMTIEEWNETRFLPDDFDVEVKEISYGDKTEILYNHRLRQSYFNLECLKAHKRNNRGWTLMIDSDEYLLPRVKDRKKQPSKPMKTVANILENFHLPPGFEKIYSPCIPINRKQFTAEESPIEKVQNMVAPGFDGMNFQTMRWRKCGFKTRYVDLSWGDTCGAIRNIPNKVMIDLRSLSLETLSSEDNMGNPHQPLDVCPDDVYTQMDKTPFLLHHYMGTPKQWFYRGNDKRGLGYRKAKYEDMNERFGSLTSDDIRPWLVEFVAAVGSEEALRLLQNVGKLEPLPYDGETGSSEATLASSSHRSNNTYKVGDIVEANFGGEGDWYPAEIYAAYSNNHYSIFFNDCTQEIATSDKRLRPTNVTMHAADIDSSTETPTSIS